MSLTDNAADVNRLLGAAAETIGKVRYCWLLTAAGEGDIRPRPMGRVPRDADEDEWTLRFMTDAARPRWPTYAVSATSPSSSSTIPTMRLSRSPGKPALPRADLRFAGAGRLPMMPIFWRAGSIERHICHNRRCPRRALDPRRDARTVRPAHDGDRAGRHAQLAPQGRLSLDHLGSLLRRRP
jgi:hypothetical protein